MGLDPQRMSAHSAAPSGPSATRAAAINVADRIAAAHPHPLDDQTPRDAGRLIAKDPAVRGDLLDLLDELGLTTDHITRGQA